MLLFPPLSLWLSLSILVGVMFALLAIFFFNSELNVDEIECFECGIDIISGNRIPFAIHFFIIAVIFVLFDAEVILSLTFIFPPIGESNWWYWWGYFCMLFWGLVLEFFIQSVDWNE